MFENVKNIRMITQNFYVDHKRKVYSFNDKTKFCCDRINNGIEYIMEDGSTILELRETYWDSTKISLIHNPIKYEDLEFTDSVILGIGDILEDAIKDYDYYIEEPPISFGVLKIHRYKLKASL